MTEFSRELIFGKRPIRRTDRKPGESEWYYLDPRGASTFSDMKKIDVPTENTPNPYANEIQNYLYKNDEYNYRELYGNTPPPSTQPSTQPATQPTAQPVTPENKGFGFQSNNRQTTFANTPNDAFGQQNNTFGTGAIKQTLSNTEQKIKDGAEIAINTAQYTPETLGELVAAIQIAKSYYDKMNNVGKRLVDMYGKGQGADIDNYYHPLLQCELAKISPTSRDWGIRLGYAKELWDYYKKIGHQSALEISTDSKKDLQNNLYGSNIGYNHLNKSCEELLDDKRTENMRKANIK